MSGDTFCGDRFSFQLVQLTDVRLFFEDLATAALATTQPAQGRGGGYTYSDYTYSDYTYSESEYSQSIVRVSIVRYLTLYTYSYYGSTYSGSAYYGYTCHRSLREIEEAAVAVARGRGAGPGCSASLWSGAEPLAPSLSVDEAQARPQGTLLQSPPPLVVHTR